MLKIAVLGANGQVGAELCLLLSQRSDVELVPISRNRSGSAFLRCLGISCRHGRPTDPSEAARLFGDCDVILNSALATGTPREIRRIEDQLINNAFSCSRRGAAIIHFSTQNVYGDPSPQARFRRLSPYGRTKLDTERTVRRAAKKWRKSAFILRLGHVMGELQNITGNIRSSLRNNSVVLPDTDVESNTVYTATILEAVLNIAMGREQPGVYDLMNAPQWTWRQIFAFEAEHCALPFRPTFVATPERPRWADAARSEVTRLARNAAAGTGVRHLAAKLLAHAPEQLSRRGQAWWYARRAQQEIAAIRRSPRALDHLSWVCNGRRFLPSLTPTRQVLAGNPYQNLTEPRSRSWPADLPDAQTRDTLSASATVPSPNNAS